jgi:hypothetical protein
MARSPRSLDELKTSIEASMADALHPQTEHDVEPAPIEPIAVVDATDRTEPRSHADRLADACNATATEIQSAGEAVVQVANGIAAETQALAELLRKHGAAIAARIEEFTAMSKRVAEKVQAARDEVATTSGTAPALAPGLERDDKK